MEVVSQMENMSAPKLEVLRFSTAEDVIVTSGTAETSFTFRAKTPYFQPAGLIWPGLWLSCAACSCLELETRAELNPGV